MTLALTHVEAADHEEVVRIADPEAGLLAFIAIHSTARGPAAGGLRMRRYASEDEAIRDVLRLSRGMTYKNAAADLPLGGGKAVILGDPARDKTPALLAAFGRAVERLEGRYWTAEDMGMTPADMAIIARESGFVAGLEGGAFASGDPSPVTARGIFRAMRVAARHRLGSDALSGCRVAVQGIGHVGWHLAERLHREGARLIVADTDAAMVARAEVELGAEAVAPEAIYAAKADIFSPCAIGAILNARTIPRLRVALVAGGANNQLEEAEDADRLHGRGILYAPDYVVNGGGIINVAAEVLRIEEREPWVLARLDALTATMDRILTQAEAQGVSPAHVADAEVGKLLG